MSRQLRAFLFAGAAILVASGGLVYLLSVDAGNVGAASTSNASPHAGGLATRSTGSTTSSPPGKPIKPEGEARPRSSADDPRSLFDQFKGKNKNPADEFRELKSALERSGTTSEGWATDAERRLGDFSSSLQKRLDASIAITAGRCFAAGCIIEIAYPHEGSYPYEHPPRDEPALLDWPGTRVETMPHRTDAGTFVQAIVLVRPRGA